ncbi:hypothetical protein BDV38DRAFT_283819 [Aspergillus pseudotamarii]|uniref:Uncharacterized protein n=1 Tax=Aspergillus pseudotamarii TaxID=132259 RepID=A0A5N6SRW0_ASPPS|nr:uncharacterized protein BDV38DRAFT_283819 [Aspergillus pseudotamarii]KAE8136607.1 hypothetical protein BDV38DRAFT_283819 [Aspergillus pseudotamarii]
MKQKLFREASLTSAQGSLLSYALVPEGNLSLTWEDATYKIESKAYGGLQLGLNAMFNVTFDSDLMPSGWEELQWSGLSVYPGISASVLHSSTNLSESMDNIASSMTGFMRTSDNAFQIPGQAYTNTTFIKVHWPRIILPVATVSLSGFFLVATALSSKRANIMLWESSMLPLLNLRLVDKKNNLSLGRLGNVHDMENVSKRIKVRMEERDVTILSEQ